MLLKNGIGQTEFRNSWKLVSNQSERQLGAFLFLYLNENRKTANYLSNPVVSFRNNVIHKGYIPTYREACDYGEDVLCFVRPILDDVKTHHENLKMELIKRRMNRVKSKIDKSRSLNATMAFPTIVSTVTVPRTKTKSCEDLILRLKEDMERKGADSIGIHTG